MMVVLKKVQSVDIAMHVSTNSINVYSAISIAYLCNRS